MNAQVHRLLALWLTGMLLLLLPGCSRIAPPTSADQDFGHQSAAFSPDGKLLAIVNGTSGGCSDLVKIWEVSTGKELFTLKGHAAAITQVLFSPDGQRLVTASNDKHVKVWDPATGKEVSTLGPHQDEVRQVLFTPDSGRLFVLNHAFSNPRSELKCWDVSTGQQIFALPRAGLLSDLAVSGNGKILVSTYRERPTQLYPIQPGLIFMWDAAKGAELLTIKLSRHPESLALSPHSDQLALLGPALQIWTISDGTLSSTIDFKRDGNDYTDLNYSPDGKWLALHGSLGVKVFDSATNRLVHDLKSKTSVHAISFSPDSTALAAGCGNHNEIYGSKGDVKIWDLKTGKLQHTFSGQRGYVANVAFSPDGRHIMSTNQVSARLWKLVP